ncbi:MAG: amylo-alpha-1,6-glucosidase [bacterium]
MIRNSHPVSGTQHAVAGTRHSASSALYSCSSSPVSMPVRRMSWPEGGPADLEAILSREWLITNGLGGYASGTVSGVCTRQYHGLLIAALPAPLGRAVMLTSLFEELLFPDGRAVELGADERSEKELHIPGARHLREFRLDSGIPIWRYETCGLVIEKSVFFPIGQNTVYVDYRLISGKEPVRLKLRPCMHFRKIHTEVSSASRRPYTIKVLPNRYEIRGADEAFPALRLFLYGRQRSLNLIGRGFRDAFYRVEQRRGYACCGSLWCPGSLEAEIRKTGADGHRYEDEHTDEDGRGYRHEDEHTEEDKHRYRHGHRHKTGRTNDRRHRQEHLSKGAGYAAVTLVASTEPWDVMLGSHPEEALEAEIARRQKLLAAAHRSVQSGPAAELVLTADQFIVTPGIRSAGSTAPTGSAGSAGSAGSHGLTGSAGSADSTGPAGSDDRAGAEGEGNTGAGGNRQQAATLIAGYHWFTDWGRDTMISLEGLTLVTGRFSEAECILHRFASHVRDGLIPNLFPEGQAEGEYNTADATLWFFHAIDRYLLATGDTAMLERLLPTLLDIKDHHQRGTLFGIGVDPADGLLRQGASGYQLTWMDAKVGDWVVTPRRGKAVEINALWYNALRLLDKWVRSGQGDEKAQPIAELAERVYDSFNRRFWYEEGGYLYDVIDGGGYGEDTSFRPNQILAISLPYPVLDPSRWKPVLEVVEKKLLTPFGLRSLSTDHPDYKRIYHGDIRERDAAYHQGTVWSWLIGPFIDAWLKVHPGDQAGARRFLDGLLAHLDQACIGSISEVFDAEPPFNPEGCVSQAWSVAQMLHCLVKTASS